MKRQFFIVVIDNGITKYFSYLITYHFVIKYLFSWKVYSFLFLSHLTKINGVLVLVLLYFFLCYYLSYCVLYLFFNGKYIAFYFCRILQK